MHGCQSACLRGPSEVRLRLGSGWALRRTSSARSRSIRTTSMRCSLPAWCAWPRGCFQDGVAHLERAAQLDPLSSTVQSALGRILYRARRFEEAVVRLNQAIALEPRNWGASCATCRRIQRDGPICGRSGAPRTGTSFSAAGPRARRRNSLCAHGQARGGQAHTRDPWCEITGPTDPIRDRSSTSTSLGPPGRFPPSSRSTEAPDWSFFAQSRRPARSEREQADGEGRVTGGYGTGMR